MRILYKQNYVGIFDEVVSEQYLSAAMMAALAQLKICSMSTVIVTVSAVLMIFRAL